MSTASIATLAWLGLPLTLAFLSVGLGLLIERLRALVLPRAIVPLLGFALFIVIGQATTAVPATAGLTMPVIAAAALAGLVLGGPRLRVGARRLQPLLVPVATYVAYLLPVAGDGRPTFAGWIKLDDGATWLAFADRMLEAGRTMTGLAPSTYEALLQVNLVDGNPAGSAGYPVGAFVPLGGMARLLGIDGAWALQPYMAACAALLACGLYALLADVIPNRGRRGAATLLASCASLLYGYALWGGVKELVIAPLLALLYWAAGKAVRQPAAAATAVPFALGLAALIAVTGPSGLPTALPAIVWFLVRVARTGRVGWPVIGTWMVLTVLGCLPALALINFTGLDGLARFAAVSDDIGNLWGHLPLAQLAGIWPVGDFRMAPIEMGPLLIVLFLVAGLAVAGLVRATRNAPALALLAGTAVASAVITSFGNAWIAGKALAVAGPFVLALAAVGIALLLEQRRRVEAACAVLLIGGGIVWSDALAYREAWLAPYDALRELEAIGHLDLPTPALATDPSVYGPRHFLRRLDTEGASDLRRNLIPLSTGAGLDKGQYADIDAFAPSAVQSYGTLVLPRSGAASRPPENYRLAWSGTDFEAWRRDPMGPQVLQHWALGSAFDAGAVPRCEDVTRFAESAPEGAALAFVERRPTTVLSLESPSRPANWQSAGGGAVVPVGDGSITLSVTVAEPGEYGLWLAGSHRGDLTVKVDGEPVFHGRHRLAAAGPLHAVGTARLGPGTHRIELTLSHGIWRPGAGGAGFSMGPLVLSTSTADAPVSTVARSQATSICGRSLDWLEVIAD